MTETQPDATNSQNELDQLRLQLQAALAERDLLRQQCGLFAPGYFYSPIPSQEEIARDEEHIFAPPARNIAGIDMREEQQLKLLGQLQRFYKDLHFSAQKTEGFRYYYENPTYSYSDAIFLYSMIRHVNPKRIIEVGSGFSSCVTLDTNDRFFNGQIQTTFIEPYPEVLNSLVREDEKPNIRLIESRLQDVSLDEFRALQANDILFIDSTHVSRVHSDVNRAFFDILPVLASGVYVHIHDVFYPFEYPKAWIKNGMYWNEQYLLRAFLQYNSAFEIQVMNTFLEHFHPDYFHAHMPLCMRNTGGSIWLRKI